MEFLGMGGKETDRAWEVYLGLGLKIPCLLWVTMPGGEGGVGGDGEDVGPEGEVAGSAERGPTGV